jgi:hypothetical protein
MLVENAFEIGVKGYLTAKIKLAFFDLNTTTPLSASHQRAVGIYFFSL